MGTPKYFNESTLWLEEKDFGKAVALLRIKKDNLLLLSISALSMSGNLRRIGKSCVFLLSFQCYLTLSKNK